MEIVTRSLGHGNEDIGTGAGWLRDRDSDVGTGDMVTETEGQCNGDSDM